VKLSSISHQTFLPFTVILSLLISLSLWPSFSLSFQFHSILPSLYHFTFTVLPSLYHFTFTLYFLLYIMSRSLCHSFSLSFYYHSAFPSLYHFTFTLSFLLFIISLSTCTSYSSVCALAIYINEEHHLLGRDAPCFGRAHCFHLQS
jgi:hypothetical protein